MTETARTESAMTETARTRRLRPDRRGRAGRFLALLLVTTAAVSAAAGDASAAAAGRHLVDTAVVEEPYDSGTSAPDPYFLQVCGLEVRLVGTSTATVSIWSDDTVTARAAESYDWYDFSTGERLLYQRDRAVANDQLLSRVVDETAGTVTDTLQSKSTGIQVRLFRPHRGVQAIDVGIASGSLTLVFDLETGELIDISADPELVAGHHPFWLDFPDTTNLDQKICELLGS